MASVSQELRELLDRLERRVRQLVWLQGISWLLLLLLPGFLIAGLSDWFWHFDSSFLRVAVVLTLFALAGAVIWRQLVRPLAMRWTPTRLAAQVEQNHHAFRGALVSAASFLEGNLSQQAGSSQLQAATVDLLRQELPHIRFDRVIDSRPIQRLLVLVSLAVIASGTIILVRPVEAGVAMSRLAFPFSTIPWPRRVQLQMLDASHRPLPQGPAQPWRVTARETVELYAINTAGPLPEEVWFEERSPGTGNIRRERLTATTIRDRRNRPVDAGLYSFQAQPGTLEFRVVGGDDTQMPFRTLEVVVPPDLDRWQVTLTPPPYARHPIQKLPPGIGQVRGLLGSMVRITAVATQPLQAATFHQGSSSAKPIVLQADQQSFSTQFSIDQPQGHAYWFSLIGKTGFSNPSPLRHEVFGIVDRPPVVQIEEPSRDRTITPDGLLNFRLAAEDDVGLRDLSLTWRLAHLTDQAPEKKLVTDLSESAPQSHQNTLEFDLRNWPVEVGQQILFQAVARDHYDLGSEHSSLSTPRIVTVITPDKKREELNDRASRLLEQLSQIRSQQQKSQTRLQTLSDRWQTNRTLQPEDREELRRIELDNQTFSDQILDETEGLSEVTAALLQDWVRSRLHDPEAQQALAQTTIRLRQDLLPRLPPLSDQLTDLRRELASPQPADNKVDSLLRETTQQQTALGPILQQLEQELTKWQDQRILTQEAQNLANDQKELSRKTTDLAARTMTKPLSQLGVQERTELQRLAERQAALADRTEQFGTKLSTRADRLQQEDANQAEDLLTLEKQLRETGLAATMRNAGQAIQQNQLGKAATDQGQAERHLEQLLGELQQRPKPLEDRLNQAQKLEARLKERWQQQLQLKDQHQKLAKDAQQADRNRLIQQQTEERRLLERIQRELQRLELPEAARKTEQATAQVREAAQKLAAENDLQAAEQQAEALQSLEQAQDSLARERQELTDALNQQKGDQVLETLNDLIDRQNTVISQTNDLRRVKQSTGNWTRAQLIQLRDLATLQKAIQDDLQALQARWNTNVVTEFTLQRASQCLSFVGERLAARDLTAAVISKQQEARDRLEVIQKALSPESSLSADATTEVKEQTDEPPTTTLDMTPQEEPHPSPEILLQLRLLKGLQELCLQRTAMLTETPPEEKDEASSRLQNLTDEQGQLAEMLQKIAEEWASQQQPVVPPTEERQP